MLRRILMIAAIAAPVLTAGAQDARDPSNWEIHDLDRPKPTVVEPATPSSRDAVGHAPSDAVILFDGTSLDAWQRPNGEPVRWKVENGYFEVVPGEGGIETQRGFGDVQLHIEWSAPDPPAGEGQDRGNSGVFLMNQYEVQVLDSYESETYADGQAAAIYGQYPPLVNAMRPPGEWNTYDIIFHRPRFDDTGAVTAPATVTVLHNGILVQDNEVLTGPSGHYSRPAYEAHADALPISLQDHDHPVRFRNVWARDLE